MLLLQSRYLYNLGIYNFCNPGAISHNEVLDLYKKHIDPSYVYTNFSLDEQAQILKAGRSNNTLGNFMILKKFLEIILFYVNNTDKFHQLVTS